MYDGITSNRLKEGIAMGMIRRLLLQGGITAATSTALAFFARYDGGAIAPKPDARALPEAGDTSLDDRLPDSFPGPGLLETAATLAGQAARLAGTRGQALRERAEALVGAYRLLRALGMTDAEIARFVAEQAAERAGRGLDQHAPDTDDMRRVVDTVQESVVRSAQLVDQRLNLNGEFVRRVRDGIQASRTGREDVLVVLDRGLGVARAQLRSLLSGSDQSEQDES